MTRPPRKAPLAGGILIPVALLVGIILGARYGQTSLGVVIGTGVGILLALLIWLVDRRRA
jgi:uncharacterized membrane protein